MKLIERSLQNDEAINYAPILIVVVGIFFLWVCTGLVLWDVEERGTFGDMFGSINALFSGLAFAGVVFAIMLQRKELALQRAELKLTREELKGQKREMALQNQTLKVQQFEHTLFSMIAVLNDIVNSIDLRKKDISKAQICTGRDCMKAFHKDLIFYLEGKRRSGDIELTYPDKTLEENYADWWKVKRTDLGHYFRTLYNIVQFINEAQTQKIIGSGKKYSRILRAQLSDQEQALLFYNCICGIGGGFLKDVKRHKLVKHVPDEFLLDPEHKTKYYSSIFK